MAEDRAAPRDGRGRFLQGNSAGKKFGPGVSGNPQGVSKLRKAFEEQFYASMTDPATVSEAMDALRKAIQEGQPWAIQLLFSKLMPPQLDLRMEVNRRDEIDWSRVSDDELEKLESIAQRIAGSSQPESGESAPEST